MRKKENGRERGKRTDIEIEKEIVMKKVKRSRDWNRDIRIDFKIC